MQWKMFIPYTWIVPLFFAALVISLETAGALVSAVAWIFHVSTPIKDLGRAGLKIIIALLLVSLFFPLKISLKMSRLANFYGNTATLFITLGVLIAACLDISFVPLFIWVFLFTFLGAIFKIPILVRVCAFITPFYGFRFLLNMLEFSRGDLPLLSEDLFFSTGRLIELILSQNIVISLYLTVITFPFIFLLQRSRTLSHARKPQAQKTEEEKKKEWLIHRIPSGILLGISLGSLVYYTYILSKIPFNPPVRRTIIEHGFPEHISETLTDGASTDILQIKTATLTFLERRDIQISLEARGKPACFNLYLDSEDGTSPVIYAAPMRFEFTNDQHSVEFILGQGPPNPFTTELVLPLSFSGSLRVEAIYTVWDPAIDTMSQPESDDYILQVVKRISLEDY
jgi:hypothetical protein